MWVYILIILIFVIRGVIKSAERQRKSGSYVPQHGNNGEIPEESGCTPVEIREIQEENTAMSGRTSRSATRRRTARTASPADEVRKRSASRTAQSAAREEEGNGYFADAEEVRKGIIAAEILNRKY